MKLNRATLRLSLLIGLVLNPTVWLCSQSADQPTGAPATTLPAGTIVRLRLTQEVDSKHAKVGDALPLEVMRDVKAGDLLVIAKHTPVVARLTRARHAPSGLRPGSLALEVETINDINGDPIAVGATKSEKGPRERQSEAYTEALLSMGLLTPTLFFLHGDEAVLPKGTEIDPSVSRDVALKVSALRQRWATLETEQAGAKERSHTGQATVHFYLRYLAVAGQKHTARHYGESHTVLLDGRKIVKLRDWSFYDTHIAPGHHVVACKGQKLELDTKAEEQYYVSVAEEPGVLARLANRWTPHLVDSETGEEQLYPLLPAKDKDVYSGGD